MILNMKMTSRVLSKCMYFLLVFKKEIAHVFILFPLLFVCLFVCLFVLFCCFVLCSVLKT
jgi:hypothetical protein